MAKPLAAAGALVWRVVDGQLEVLLVHRPRYNDWSWPKGKLEPGENVLTCVTREVMEETGRQVIVGRPLPPVTYPLKSGRLKQVRYWAARLVTDDAVSAVLARSPVTICSPREVDRTAWLSAEQAMRRLTQPGDRMPLLKLMRYFQKGTLETRAVVVLRHAQAVPRGQWPKDEAGRPLTDKGRVLARAAVSPLAAFGLTQVITSPWKRCKATVAPFARQARLPLGTSRWLTEASAARRPERAAHLMSQVLGGGGTVLVCSHRPVLPLLLDRVLAAGGSKLAAKLADQPLRVGEAAVAHVLVNGQRRGRVVALERHPIAS
ncbi:MAG: NUDIX hydrolase [Micrococcales bacterium]|nr:NUDIX hydrolase [Micrococcales bacterium]